MRKSMFRPNLMQCLCAAVLLAVTGWASALDLSQPLPVNPKVKVGKLENGLTYYIEHNAKPEKRVELRLVVKAGSILEDQDQQGLAHFVEHMAFNGSQHFKKHELISYLQSIGVKFGADLNAYTSFDETVYMLPIPLEDQVAKSGRSNLETGMQVLQDWAGGLTLAGKDIDAERKIILEEARLGKGANDRMNRQLYPDLFSGSRYAERLPIGKEDIISNFRHDVLRRFYHDWYRPDLEAVFVVGDIDPVAVEAMIRQHFSGLKNPAHERPRAYAPIPERKTSTALVITDPESTNNMVIVRYPTRPAAEEKKLADYRESLIRNLMSAILNQRLQELTQQASPPYLLGASGFDGVARGYESYSEFAYIGRTGVQAALDALVSESEKARQFGFSADELARAGKSLLRQYETQYNERDKSESGQIVSEYIRNFLTDEPIPGIANEYDYARAMVPGITLEEVNHYAATNIPDGAAKLVAYLGSDKAGEQIPQSAQLLGWVNDAEKRTVAANQDKALPATLMSAPPVAGSIVSESVNAQLGLTELTLSNGLKVILKPTDFKDDQILLSASRFGGQSLFGDEDVFNARYAVPVTSAMGLAQFTPTDLEKILAGKSVSLAPGLGNYTDGVTGYAASADLETLFQALALRFAPARQDPALFDAFVSRMQDLSRNNISRPETVFSNALMSTLYNNHPRVALAPRPEDFGHVSLAGSTGVYDHRFESARGLTFILVGSFKVEAVKPLIATYLASLPVGEVPLADKDLQVRPVHGIVKKEVHAGQEQKSQVAILFTGAAEYSKAENMRFQAMIEVMNLRIIDVLREKLGLIYSGGMSGSMERVPYQNFRIGMTLPCGPQNVDKVVKAAFEEVARIREQGPTAEELNKVKKNWITNNDIAMRTNEHWLSYLQDATLYQTDPADILTVAQRMSGLTQEDVRQAANRYLTPDNYVQVVLYPAQPAAAN